VKGRDPKLLLNLGPSEPCYATAWARNTWTRNTRPYRFWYTCRTSNTRSYRQGG